MSSHQEHTQGTGNHAEAQPCTGTLQASSSAFGRKREFENEGVLPLPALTEAQKLLSSMVVGRIQLSGWLSMPQTEGPLGSGRRADTTNCWPCSIHFHLSLSSACTVDTPQQDLNVPGPLQNFAS